MTDHDPTDPDRRDDPRDDLVSAVLDGEATADEVARVDSDPELAARLARFRVLADSVGTAAEPPAGLADRVVATALTHLSPATGPVAPPVDGLSARRAARLQRAAPLLAAAAVVLLLAVGFVAVRNLDSESADTASADLSAADTADDAARGSESADDAATESATPLDPAADAGSSFSAADPIVADDLAGFEAAVRDRLDVASTAATSTTRAVPGGEEAPAAEADGPACDVQPTARAALTTGLTGTGELGGAPVTFTVYDTAVGQLLVITDTTCTVIAEIDL